MTPNLLRALLATVGMAFCFAAMLWALGISLGEWRAGLAFVALTTLLDLHHYREALKKDKQP